MPGLLPVQNYPSAIDTETCQVNWCKPGRHVSIQTFPVFHQELYLDQNIFSKKSKENQFCQKILNQFYCYTNFHRARTHSTVENTAFLIKCKNEILIVCYYQSYFNFSVSRDPNHIQAFGTAFCLHFYVVSIRSGIFFKSLLHNIPVCYIQLLHYNSEKELLWKNIRTGKKSMLLVLIHNLMLTLKDLYL